MPAAFRSRSRIRQNAFGMLSNRVEAGRSTATASRRKASTFSLDFEPVIQCRAPRLTQVRHFKDRQVRGLGASQSRKDRDAPRQTGGGAEFFQFRIRFAGQSSVHPSSHVARSFPAFRARCGILNLGLPLPQPFD